MAVKKIKLNIDGQIFELPLDTLRTNNVGKKYIYLNAKNTASIIKQYLKKIDPIISNWVTSQTYSMGCSVNVWVCNPDGSPVDDVLYKQIEKFAYDFQAGDFNGMDDSYSYRDDGTTANGTTLDYGAKYVFVENRPKFDTVEYALNSISKGETVEDSIKYMRDDVKAKVREMFKTK